MRFTALVRLELAALSSRSGEIATGLAVLLLAVTLFALSQPAGSLAPAASRAAIWVAVFIVGAMTQFSLFAEDRRSGFLDQWPLLPIPMEAAVAAKLATHWLAYGLGFCLAAPVAALLGGIPSGEWLGLVVSIAPASLCLTTLGGIAAATSIRFRHGERIGMLLVLPLCVPVAVFGAAGPAGLALLLAGTLLIVPTGVLLTARLLRYPD